MHTFYQSGTSFGCFVAPDRWGGGVVRILSDNPVNLDILWTYMHTHPCSCVHAYHLYEYVFVFPKCPDFHDSWTICRQAPLPGGPVAQSIQNLSPFGKVCACARDQIDMHITQMVMHTLFQTGTSLGCFVLPDRQGGAAVRILSTDHVNLDILWTCIHTHSGDIHVYLIAASQHRSMAFAASST